MSRFLLGLASRGYGAGVAARLALYRARLLRTSRAARPVISVGNVAAGGTGKTPFLAWLAAELQARGHRPSILTRGYGRKSRGTVVVSNGSGSMETVERSGDEPSMLARTLPDVPIVADERRVRAAATAERLFPSITHHLLDDGFSHVALERDVDIVLLDATDPAAGGSLLPLGRLREPLRSLQRADVVVVTKVEQADPSPAIALAERYAPGATVYRAQTEVIGILDGRGNDVEPINLPPGTVVAAAGIARPEAFWRTLETLGIEPMASLAFPDHASYGDLRLGRILRTVEETGACGLVTTEKDAVKLEGRLPVPLFRVRIGMRVLEPAFVPDVLAYINRLPA